MRKKLIIICTLLLALSIIPLAAKTNGNKTNPIFSSTQTFRVILDPNQLTKLSAEVSSPVEKITKKMGDSFEEGEVLIQLQNGVFQANLEESQALLDKARVELEGRKQLFNDNVSSLFDYKKAEAGFASAKAELALSQKRFDSTIIKAPYSGKIVDFTIREYELTEVGEQLIEIIDDHVLIAKMLISAEFLPSIQVGQPFQIELENSKETIDATVLRIGSIIDPSSSTIPIEAEIDNSSGKYTAGQRGQAKFS